MVGLLGRRGLDAGTGLILDPCRMIHTAFMRFSLDIVFIDRQLHVTRIARDVRPFRLAWGGWRAHYTLELAAGALGAHDPEAGEPTADGDLSSKALAPGARLFFSPID